MSVVGGLVGWRTGGSGPGWFGLLRLGHGTKIVISHTADDFRQAFSPRESQTAVENSSRARLLRFGFRYR